MGYLSSQEIYSLPATDNYYILRNHPDVCFAGGTSKLQKEGKIPVSCIPEERRVMDNQVIIRADGVFV